MLRSWRPLASVVLVFNLSAACDESSSKDETPELAGTGCIQGVAINAITGERVSLEQNGNDRGIFVLQRSELRGAALLGNNTDEDPLRGEYYVCGIFVDERFPMFAHIDGYAPYESLVKVTSTHPSRSTYAETDLIKPRPTELVNILLYPKEEQVQDLSLTVTHNGTAVEGAKVHLRPTGGNFLDPAGSAFWPAANIRQKPLNGITDASGLVTFPAANLILGGRYTYTVIPPNGGAELSAVNAGIVIIGLRDANDRSDPYQLYVNLEHNAADLVELSRSTDVNDPNASGELIIYFNREIEVVPGTIDQATAELFNKTTAALAPNVYGNNSCESAGIKVSGNMLILTPNFVTFPHADISKEINLRIDYQGIVVRPRASPETTTHLEVTGSVSFYR